MENIMYKISHGMYVLTTKDGGCIVDAVSKISGGDNPLLSIAVNKKNYTNELMHSSSKCCLSIIGKNTDPEVISEFGFKSMREHNKLEYKNLINVDSGYAVSDSLGYFNLEKVDTIENDTHTVFICKVIDSKELNDDVEITYNYYREHKDELLKTKDEQGNTVWVCTVCGYVYHGEELPEDYVCPICKADASRFKKN